MIDRFVAVVSREVGGRMVPTVNARELHRFLECDQDFQNWMLTSIQELGYTEGQDFVVEIKRKGADASGRVCGQIEYFLTRESALDLALVATGPKGRMMRRDAMDCEEIAFGATADIEAVGPACLPGFRTPFVRNEPVEPAESQEAFPLLVIDWSRRNELRGCSLAARGLWHEMECIMYLTTPRGYLCAGDEAISPDVLADMIGADEATVRRLMDELERAGIYGRDHEDVIFSPRLVGDVSRRAQWPQRGDRTPQSGRTGTNFTG